MQKSFKLDKAFINNVEKLQTAFISLEDYHYDYDILNMLTLLGSLLSQNIKYQQILSAKYTVLMLRVR